MTRDQIQCVRDLVADRRMNLVDYRNSLDPSDESMTRHEAEAKAHALKWVLGLLDQLLAGDRE